MNNGPAFDFGSFSKPSSNFFRLNSAGVLHVSGTNGNDFISIRQGAGKLVAFTVLNGKRETHKHSAAGVKSLSIKGFGGNDVLKNQTKLKAKISGGKGNDKVFGGNAADNLSGGTGNDRLFGRGGRDVLSGEAGNDMLNGGEGNDFLNGGRGNDVLLGGDGKDKVRGDAGSDRMFGGSGNDTLLGGRGNDKLFGQKGNDRLDGGSGVDLASYRDSRASVDVNLAKGRAKSKQGNDRLAAIENIDGSRFNDFIRGNRSVNVLRGLGGNDRLYGEFPDKISGGGQAGDFLQMTYNVDSRADISNGNFSAGNLTLRESVEAARRSSNSEDLIRFRRLMGGGSQTIVLSKQLTLDANNVKIIGNGRDLLTLHGNTSNRHFEVTASTTALISGLSLVQGRAGFGGSIYNRGELTISNSTMSGNEATAYDGGGVYNDGLLSVTSSTVFGNTAKYDGGGFYNEGALTVTNSTVSTNAAGDEGGGFHNAGSGSTLTINNSVLSANRATLDSGFSRGGGLYNTFGSVSITNSTVSGNSASNGGGVYNNGRVTIANSTVSGNTAEFLGGGLHNFGSQSVLTVTSSTVSENSATGYDGGGLYNRYGDVTVSSSTFSANSARYGGGLFNELASGGGELTLTNSTLSGNVANHSGGGLYNAGKLTLTNCTVAYNRAGRYGAGIYATAAYRTNNSIYAQNRLFSGTLYDLSGTVHRSDSFNNLVTSSIYNGGLTNGNFVGVSASLESLADNGGPTQTHALKAGSYAINRGNSARAVDYLGTALSTDQRGVGYSRFHGTVDIGAYEFQ